MTNWIIRSKLEPSARLQTLLPRERLLMQLDGALSRRATILHAPAGFGKTSLLAYWYNNLSLRKIKVAWLSLDDGDADSIQFLSYFIEACKLDGLIANKDMSFPANSKVLNVADSVVSNILMELGGSRDQAVIILDDLHRADNDVVHQVLNRLLANLPDNLHLVLCTREISPDIRLADYRARDEILDISQAQLHFTTDEIRTYLTMLVKGEQLDDWPEQIYDRTGGWPIALNAIRRWLAEGIDISEALQQLSGRSSDLSDYFMEQVFQNLSETERVFLFKTSILERVNGDLADYLCEHDNSWQLLEQLDRKDLFVQPIDRERQWYKYHGLFSEFLQERLKRSTGKAIGDLHKRASLWFFENDYSLEAIRHAYLCGDGEFVAELFEKLGGWNYGLHGHIYALERALKFIDPQTLNKYPRVWFGFIYLAIAKGEVETAEREFSKLVELMAEQLASDSQLDCELKILRCLLNVYEDKAIPHAQLKELEDVAEKLLPTSHAMHAVRCNLLCAVYGNLGQFDKALSVGDQAIRHFREIGSVFGEVFIYFHEGCACLAQGRYRDAETLYKNGYELAVEHFGPENDLTAIASAFMAEVAYEQNKITEAKRLLEFALPHIEQFNSWLEVYVSAYLTAMKVAYFSGGIDALNEVLFRAHSTAANRGLPRLRIIVNMQAIDLQLRNCDLAQANDIYSKMEMFLDGAAEHPLIEHLKNSIQWRYRLMHAESGATEAFEKIRQLAHEQGRIRPYIHYSIVLAIAYWNMNEKDESLKVLEEALIPSIFEEAKRVYIDEGEAFQSLLTGLLDIETQQRGGRLRDRFLSELMVELNASGEIESKCKDGLSRREYEVMRYLSQGFSNKEISLEMDVSINTVKFHVKNIYEKLGVSNRKDAVSASIRQGISQF
ncbi:LuxR C-terminal-related transcriptional regulator [Porticoccus sp. GXU_MW_L64]